MNPEDPIAQSIGFDLEEAAADPSRAQSLMRILPQLLAGGRQTPPGYGFPQTGEQALSDVNAMAGQAPAGLPGDVKWGTNLGEIYARRGALEEAGARTDVLEQTGRSQTALELLKMMGKGQESKVVGKSLIDPTTGRVIYREPEGRMAVSPGSVVIGDGGQVLFKAPDKPDLQVVEGLFADKATGQFRDVSGKILTQDEVTAHIREMAFARSTKVQQSVGMPALAKDLSAEAAKILTDSRTKTEGAVSTLNTIADLRPILSQSFTGPGATWQQMGLRIADKIGIAGKDEKKRLAATARVMQGLASQELAAAATLRGQGVITEKERELIKRASAGTVEMSQPELKELFVALEKTARWRVGQHERLLNMAEKDVPGSSGYFRVDPGTAQTGPTAPTGLPPGWTVKQK